MLIYKIIEYNLHGLRAIGADESANLAGKSFFDVLENHSGGQRIAFQKVLSEKKQRVFWGYRSLSPKKRETFWDYTISNLDGGILFSAVEVTDRVNAERGLQECYRKRPAIGADKFRVVVGQMSDGVIDCDRCRNKS